MKEPVTVLIPVFSGSLTAVAMNSLATIQTHLGDFPITFIKGESLTQVDELSEFCPTADFVSFDDRYFSNRTGYAKLLLGTELYHDFGWSRYLLICELNTIITRNELAYWCRQGYDFIQPCPPFRVERSLMTSAKMRFDTQNFINNNKTDLTSFGKTSGVSLRNIEAFMKLTKRKRRTIQRYLSLDPDLENDAVFWEFYANHWWPEMNTPTTLSRNHFAQSASVVAQNRSDSTMPFAISGLVKPLPAPDYL